MSEKHKKQFGVWMDLHHATVIGRKGDDFAVIGTAKNPETPGNSNENTKHNHQQTLLSKYFKEIATHITNAEEVHITGPGTAQEQFIHFLADTPQFKDVKTSECTTKKMSDDALVEHITKEFS